MRATAPERTDARKELARSEWLSKVIVRTGIEAGDAILDAVERRQNENGQVVPHRSRRATQVEARSVGQSNVDDGGVVALSFEDGPRLRALGDDGHRVTCPTQRALDEAGDALAVFHDKHAHAWLIPASRYA
jgi:hypothetical protein